MIPPLDPVVAEIIPLLPLRDTTTMTPQRQQRNDLCDDGIERWNHAGSASLRNEAAA